MLLLEVLIDWSPRFESCLHGLREDSTKEAEFEKSAKFPVKSIDSNAKRPSKIWIPNERHIVRL